MSLTSPIFIHAWWRSSSTYVWAKLRQDGALCCYYEPLSEQIAALGPDAVESSAARAVRTALRHPVPDRAYFAEYLESGMSAVALYSRRLAYDRYLLRPGDEDAGLRRYLDELIDIPARTGRRAVLCFCRSQMRSAWMKQAFGGLHVAQIRNPRDQWASFQVDPYFLQRLLFLAFKLYAAFPAAFAHIARFAEQAQALSSPAARASPAKGRQITLGKRDALRLFLLVWMASALQSIGACDFVLDADRLSADAACRDEAVAWFRSAGCNVDFSDCATPSSATPGSAGDEMFRRAMADSVSAIRSNASSLVVADTRAVADRLSSLSGASRKILEDLLAA